MNRDGLIRVVLVFIAAVLFAVGMGPLVVSGLDDVVRLGAATFLMTHIVIAALIVTFLIASFYMLKNSGQQLRYWTSSAKLWPILIGAVVMAFVSIQIASTDHNNNTAWRYTEKIQPGDGINARTSREFGRFFSTLAVQDNAETDRTLATFPTSWTSWVAGGRTTLLLRVKDNGDAPAACGGGKRLVFAAVKSNLVVAETAIERRDVCERWQRLDLASPAGATELRLSAAGSSSSSKIDVMVVAHQANWQNFWDFCMVLAIALVIAVIYIFSTTTRSASNTATMPSFGTRRQKLALGAALLLFVIGGNAFVHAYVSQERTIYSWDFAGYWTSTINVSGFLKGADRKSASQPGSQEQRVAGDGVPNEPSFSMPDPTAVVALLRNFRFAEYNVSSNLPVAPVLAAFGDSRMVYELSLLNIYAFAAVAMFVLALRAASRAGGNRWPDWWPFIPIVCVFCTIPFWIPILRGYMGISILAVNFATLWLYFRKPAAELRTTEFVLIGALLLVGVMLQRWNAYWVVAYLLMLGVDSAIALTRAGTITVGKLASAFRAPIVIGFSALFLFVTAAWPKLVRTITTDYADIYSAYLEDDGLLQALGKLVNTFGGGFIILTVVAIVYLIADRESRKIPLLLVIQFTVMFIHFAGTQTFGPHQIYLLMPSILIIMGLGINKAMSASESKIRATACAAFGLLIFSGYASGMAAFTTAATPPPVNQAGLSLLSRSYRPPLIRGDIDEFVRLAQFIDRELPDGSQFYVAAGSQTLNAGHFKNIGISTGIEFAAADNVQSSSVVDKRDGFPRGILTADLIVTSDPVQLSRAAADHQVIRVPVENLDNGTGIGAAFSRLDETFLLGNDIEVVIYKRVRPNSPAEIADLSERLKAFYPDRPDVYQ